jgi:predicted transcriptional regulator
LVDELTPEQQKDAMKRLADADSGEIITHIEAVEIFEKYGLK